MGKQRPRVPTDLKQRLVDEAGGKCANPGCPAYRTHLHHVEEWAVYETHDQEHMIALCPTCHDAVHNGPLVVDDETIYRWKGVERPQAVQRDHVYVEPAGWPTLALGTIGVTGNKKGVTVFDLAPSNKLSFRLVDEDVMLLNLAISTMSGEEVLRVVEGHVRRADESRVTYERISGHILVTAPATEDFIPSWAIRQLRLQEPAFAAAGTMPVLDLEVLKPGVVRVQGIWSAPGHVVAITIERLAFMHPGLREPVSMVGAGYDRSGLVYDGAIDTSLFELLGSGTGSQGA